MKQRILIKNAKAIVTCDKNDSVLYDTDILIEAPAIMAIGKDIPEEKIGDAEVIDGRNKFVYPGLINTHHHFFQTFVRNLITIDFPSMSVIDWINEIYEIFKLIDSDAIYYSTLIAMTDLVKHGCTTAFDHQYCYPRHAGKELVDRQMEAAELLGIRYHAGRGANTLKKSKGSTVPDEMVETTDEFLSDCDRLIKLYHDDKPFSMKQIVVAPCQPINCHRETFAESLNFAREKGVRLHTHLGEGENGPMVERWGERTLQWCEKLGFIGPDVWFAHGWELTPEEYKVMAATGTGLSHCPAPATLGGFPILDIPAMHSSGMMLGLGCDGSATNDSSNLLDSIRMAYLMQAFHTKERNGGASAYDILKMATAGGAEIMGRGDLGALETGKGADLFMIDVTKLELAGALHDPANLIGRVGLTSEVWLTMINGKVVFKEGRISGLDENTLAEKAEECCTRVIRDQSGTAFPK
ncbi:MAG: amidohydrolase family protein [Spirochaetales bacterium]|nr:amidohydrolase family protein [Spirochaetales bacterium]